MKNALWSAVHDLFREVDLLMSRGERFDGEAAPAAAPVAEPQPQRKGAAAKAGFFKAYVEKDDILEVRQKLRSRLDVVKATLSIHLTEREGFLVLFPLVVFFDELVQNRFVAGGGSWPPLQSELFQIDDGGAAFYDTLDDLLRKPDTLPFVYEIFYLCLSNGFLGRYADNPAKVTEYKTKLAAKIPTPTVAGRGEAPRTASSSFATFPAWRYLGVAAVLVSTYVVLQFAAGYLGA